jgi:hypothetical protein
MADESASAAPREAWLRVCDSRLGVVIPPSRKIALTDGRPAPDEPSSEFAAGRVAWARVERDGTGWTAVRM